MPRGLTRRLPALLIAAAAVASLSASGCATEAAAATVGDTAISRDDLMSEVEAMAENDSVLQAFGVPEDQVAGEANADTSYSQPFVGYVLTNRIVNLLFEKVMDERDLTVRDQDVSTAEQQMSQAFGSSASKLPEAFREQLTEDLAVSARLAEEFGDDEEGQQDLFTAIQEQAAKTDVEVASKYGEWDKDNLQIVPPEGPLQPGGETDDTVPQP